MVLFLSLESQRCHVLRGIIELSTLVNGKSEILILKASSPTTYSLLVVFLGRFFRLYLISWLRNLHVKLRSRGYGPCKSHLHLICLPFPCSSLACMVRNSKWFVGSTKWWWTFMIYFLPQGIGFVILWVHMKMEDGGILEIRWVLSKHYQPMSSCLLVFQSWKCV